MGAVISACGKYRYKLWRNTSNFGGRTAIIMVNPSTADAEKDDATIGKLRGFGERKGWGEMNAEKRQIIAWLDGGETIEEIAARVDRHPITVKRILKARHTLFSACSGRLSNRSLPAQLAGDR